LLICGKQNDISKSGRNFGADLERWKNIKERWKRGSREEARVKTTKSRGKVM